MYFNEDKKYLIKRIILYVIDGILAIFFLALSLYDTMIIPSSRITQNAVPEFINEKKGYVLIFILILFVVVGFYLYAADETVSKGMIIFVFLLIINALQLFSLFYYSQKYIRILGKEIIIVNYDSETHYTFDDIEECCEYEPSARQESVFQITFKDGKVITLGGAITVKNGCWAQRFEDDWDYYYAIKEYVDSKKGDNVSN